MALIDTEGSSINLGTNGYYPPMGYNNGGFFGNGDGIWAILLFAMIFGNGWGGFGGFGGFGGMGGGLGLADGGLLGYAIGNNATKGDLSDGFNSLHLSNQIEGVRDGVAGLANQLCNSTASVNQTLSNGFYNAEIAANNRQMADMNQNFALQSQLASCCCENRLSNADLKYTIATENCEDRAVVASGIRDIIESNTRNTQAILDKLCQQEIEAKNDQIATLRTQLNMANLAASQTAQTAEIRQNNATVANQLVAELRSCPIPAMPVYGNQAIFTCPNNGCGCGSIQ